MIKPLAIGLGACIALPNLLLAAPSLPTNHGPVTGAVDDLGNDVFLGVPFAAPPLDALRWAPPQSPTPWEGPREALTMPVPCTQMGTVVDPSTGEEVSAPIGSEDCLYLNVWRPEGALQGGASERPILVWIHGGANTLGAISEPWYRGASLAASQNAVVVSMQYRLSTMGFFNHPDLETGDPLRDSGNFALLDQLKALEWVRDNAVALGGNPEKVMIFGESAGGYNAWSLTLSPLGNDLFASSAVQSGCTSWISKGDAQEQARRILETLVLADGLATEDTIGAYIEGQPPGWAEGYLRGAGADEILGALNDAGLFTFNFAGIEDGVVLPLDGASAFREGRYQGRPTIIGATRDESRALFALFYPMGLGAYNVLMDALYGENRGAVEALYPRQDYRGPDMLYRRMTDTADAILELACGSGVALTASEHHPVWLYRFDYDALLPPLDVSFGALHTAEIPFVFGNLDDGQPFQEGTEDERILLSQQMQRAWACLARSGSPHGCPGTLPWPALDGTRPERRLYDAPSTLERVPQTELEKIEFWLGYGARNPGLGEMQMLDGARFESLDP